MPTVGTLVRRLRTHRDWSLTELSEKSGVRAEDIGRIERGKQKPQARTIKKLARAFGVDVAQLEDVPSIAPDTELHDVAHKRTKSHLQTKQKEGIDSQVKESARREAEMSERFVVDLSDFAGDLTVEQKRLFRARAHEACAAMVQGLPFHWAINEETG